MKKITSAEYKNRLQHLRDIGDVDSIMRFVDEYEIDDGNPNSEIKSGNPKSTIKSGNVIRIGIGKSKPFSETLIKQLNGKSKSSSNNRKSNCKSESEKKVWKSLEVDSKVATMLVNRYHTSHNDFTMKNFLIINKISYKINVVDEITIKTKQGKFNLKGSYEIVSFIDSNGFKRLLKGMF